MRKVTLLFGVHNHQPVGNFGVVFEQLYARSYEPFARILRAHPKVKCTFHVTGPLWEWMEEHAPDYGKWLKEMAARGQVELFAGGMYEPILPILPDRDKVGQVRMMVDHLKKHLGVTARGMWVAERVWEPHLPKALREAGIEYITIDDAHLKSAGFREEDTYGYYLTEEQGSTLGVFPISEKMRYLVPFRQVNETIDFLRSVATEDGERCVVLMDDGEKFGGWPDTYGWVFEQGWLERFFKALEDNSDWIETATFSEWFDRHRPRGSAYLPSASYTEMGEWSLLPEAAREYEGLRHELRDRNELSRFERYLKGGFWRNFLPKYAESNHLHKRMLLVSAHVEAAEKAAARPKASPGDAAQAARARRSLYRGQCNCPYWHGIFGGLYLNHLRYAVYHELLEAEKRADAVLAPLVNGFDATEADFDADGVRELLLGSDQYRAILDPGEGGALVELDDLRHPFNLSDTLTRRPEAYHWKLKAMAEGPGQDGSPASIHEVVRTKEPGLEHMLWYDDYRRASLLDRFLDPGTGVEDLRRSRAAERGDFLGRPFTLTWAAPRRKGGPLTVEMERLGSLALGDARQPLRLVKRLTFEPGDLELQVVLLFENRGHRPLRTAYRSEWNLTFLTGTAPDRRYYVKGRELADPLLGSVGEEGDVTEAGMTDGWLGLKVSFASKEALRFLRYPVETVSQSEGGFERVYQGSCLLFGWDLDLPPGGSTERTFTVRMKPWKG
jgi:alpha-amylase